MENLLEEVRKEAIALRRHATRTERRQIKLSKINPFSPWTCIYGQMTGSCHSQRAGELLEACAVPYAFQIPDPNGDIGDPEDEEVIQGYIVSGEEEKKANEIRFNNDNGIRRYFSAIEFLLAVGTHEQIKAVAQYISGKCSKLEL